MERAFEATTAVTASPTTTSAYSNGTSNDTDCLAFNFTTTEDHIVFYTSASSNLLGLVSSVVAIVFVVVTRAYKVPVNRLILYLSVDTLLYTIVTPFVFYLDGSGVPSKVCLFWSVYFRLLYSIFVCWISIYVFVLVVLKVKLKRARYEVIGILFVLLIPLTFVWTVPVYAEGPGRCVLNHNYLTFILCGLGLPYLLSITLAAVTIIFYTMSLCSDLCKSRAFHVPMIKLVPFILFVLIQNSFSVISLAIVVLMMNFVLSSVLVCVYAVMFALDFVSIPFLLLCQPKIRRKLAAGICNCCRCRRLKGSRERQRSVIQNYSNRSASHTQFSAPSPPSVTHFSEEEVLIVRHDSASD